MKEFEKKVSDFSYKTENSLKESIKQEQLGTAEENQGVGDLINNYTNSNYQRMKTKPYIEHLQNQVSLIDMFFNLTESLRCEVRFITSF